MKSAKFTYTAQEAKIRTDNMERFNEYYNLLVKLVDEGIIRAIKKQEYYVNISVSAKDGIECEVIQAIQDELRSLGYDINDLSQNSTSCSFYVRWREPNEIEC